MFYRPEALEDLARLPHDVVVPAVVFTERARQLAEEGVPSDEFADHLAANEFAIEAYGRKQAKRFAIDVHEPDAWRRLARDAMIAGHVRKEDGDVLWTTDPDDFRELGLSEDAIVEV